MKKYTSIFGLLALAFFLTACGNDEPVAGTEPTDEMQQAAMAQQESAKQVLPDGFVYDINGNIIKKASDPSSTAYYVQLPDGKVVMMDELAQGLQTVYFDFDKYNLTSIAQNKVQQNSEFLQSNAPGINLRIEGNTDEWGTDEYNYALGLKRALSVRNALVENGVDQSKTVLVSYGESKPICSDKTKKCWGENRRVEFKLVP